QAAQAGAYSVLIAYADGALISVDAILTVTTVLNLPEALDVVGMPLTVSTVGTPAWFGQTNVTHDHVDAAESGPIADGTATTIQIVLTGPGNLSFWWKVS